MSKEGTSKTLILSLYRQLLKSGNRFADYNFREYTLRVVKEDFRAHKNETDDKKIKELYYKGIEQAAIVARQSAINMIYAHKLNFLDPMIEKSRKL